MRRRRDYRDLEGEDAGGQGEEERGREEGGRGQGEEERGREEEVRGPGVDGVSSNVRLSVDSPSQVLMVCAIYKTLLENSVADLYTNQDPSDPYVLEPSGSGSFYHKAKIVRKTLIPTVLLLLFDFLSLKNVPPKSNKQKNFFFKISFLLAPWRSMTKIGGSATLLENAPKRNAEND